MQIENQQFLIENLEVFEHTPFVSHDRVERDQEAPETDWKLISIGKIKLMKGVKEIKISSLQIPGNQSIELKEIIISKTEF